MKFACAAALVAVLLAGCGSSPPDSEQCDAILKKQADLDVSGKSPEDAERIRKSYVDSYAKNHADCIGGRTYNRDDYKCLMAANSKEERDSCSGAMVKRMMGKLSQH